MKEQVSIYLHIPFCQKRCSYCDFNTYSGMNRFIPEYINQLQKELEFYGQNINEDWEVKTIFFGGGTPSLLKEQHFSQLFTTLKKEFEIIPDAEISLEANPGTVNAVYLDNLRKLGFNRISFGLQTSNPGQLALLGRIHDHFQSIEAIAWAKKVGFTNINLDLIYGLPTQTLEAWKKTLEDGICLGTQHISLYALGIEENTPLFDWVEKGLVENPDPDLAAEMYEIADEILLRNGYECYEISNYYKKDEKHDFRCQHNLQYWQNKPYLGLGAGAHGFFKGYRYENVAGIGEYINLMKKNELSKTDHSPVILHETPIDEFTEMQETMMVGLRLVKAGVSIQDFQKRFNQSPLTVFKKEIGSLMNKHLLEIIDEDAIRLTKKARLLGNLVFQQFVN